jgi:hypothetical protein
MAVVRNVALMALALLVVLSFDGWLSFDATIDGDRRLGLVPLVTCYDGFLGCPDPVEAVPVALLALFNVIVVVFGGRAVSTVQTTLRGLGFR